jgi:hypothetical protein
MNLQGRLDRYRNRGIQELGIRQGIHRGTDVTAKLCTVELRPVLPLPLFEDLAKDDFESVRRSVRTVFSEWLVEVPR